MRFGLADLEELPSLKEFEQLAQAALGADDGIAPTEPDEAPPATESSAELSVANSETKDAAPAGANEVIADSGSTGSGLEQGPSVTPDSKAAASAS